MNTETESPDSSGSRALAALKLILFSGVGIGLFLMPFVLNTVAEVIRLRFRKRAFQL